MIFGNIDNLGDKKKYSPIILEGLNLLKNGKWEEKENGKYEIKGEDMFIVLSEYKTSPAEEKKPEVHKKYIDIQYIFAGEETIKIAIDNNKNTIFSNYSEEKDIMFYEKVDDETALIMKKGCFAVFYPEDIHKPGCNYKGASKVHKAVMKIKVDL